MQPINVRIIWTKNLVVIKFWQTWIINPWLLVYETGNICVCVKNHIPPKLIQSLMKLSKTVFIINFF